MNSLGRYLNVSAYAHTYTFQHKQHTKIIKEDDSYWYTEDNPTQSLDKYCWKEYLLPENFNPNKKHYEIYY